MVVGFFSLLQVVLCVRALTGCRREHFVPGVLGAVARLAFAALLAAAMVTSPLALIPGLNKPALASGVAALATVVAAIGGPMTSFAVLALAHRRTRDAIAADEERLGRPFMLWLPVASFDAVSVVLQVFAMWFARDL
jgi:hypothetical protein